MKANLHPYLSFAGNCAEAFAFYREAIAAGGGELRIKTHGEAPAEAGVTEDWKEKVLHAHFEFGELVLFGSDIPPLHRVQPNPMVNLALGLDSIERTETVFVALSEGGTVFMPVQKTFWAERFGMLRDRYGFSWMVSYDPA